MEQSLPGISHEDLLGTLARADAGRIKEFAETLIPQLDGIEVLHSRTGLVMLPMRDTSRGTAFHLGEVLVSEAHIRRDGVEAYGMRRGRDLEAAMAMALVDLAVAAGIAHAECVGFVRAQADAAASEDADVLRRVEATRVNMETF